MTGSTKSRSDLLGASVRLPADQGGMLNETARDASTQQPDAKAAQMDGPCDRHGCQRLNLISIADRQAAADAALVNVQEGHEGIRLLPAGCAASQVVLHRRVVMVRVGEQRFDVGVHPLEALVA
ncbi:hypothetical protein Q9R29_15745 [Rothia sp. ARF10]|nr:hypothetical protein [Rothia sp. ARF10]